MSGGSGGKMEENTNRREFDRSSTSDRPVDQSPIAKVNEANGRKEMESSGNFWDLWCLGLVVLQNGEF